MDLKMYTANVFEKRATTHAQKIFQGTVNIWNALYRLQILKQPTVPKTVSGLLSTWKNVHDPVLDMRSDYIIPVYHHSKIFRVIIDWDYWKNKDPVLPEDALIWFTDGSKTDSGTGSGISGIRPKRRFSFPLGKYATAFQTEICAILQCACENLRRAYKHKRILIFVTARLRLGHLVARK
jgi:hypothetical protein